MRFKRKTLQKNIIKAQKLNVCIFSSLPFVKIKNIKQKESFFKISLFFPFLFVINICQSVFSSFNFRHIKVEIQNSFTFFPLFCPCVLCFLFLHICLFFNDIFESSIISNNISCSFLSDFKQKTFLAFFCFPRFFKVGFTHL